MIKITNLRIFVATVAAFSFIVLGTAHAQDAKPKKPLPPKNTPIVPPSNKMPELPDSSVFTKKEKKANKIVDKPTGEKYNDFDVFIDPQNKKFYLDKKGEKHYIPEEER